MKTFSIYVFAFVVLLSFWLVIASEASSENDPFPGFRPCKVDPDRKVDETPFDSPPLPRAALKSQVGHKYRWYVNDATGEFLYRNMGKSKRGLQ